MSPVQQTCRTCGRAREEGHHWAPDTCPTCFVEANVPEEELREAQELMALVTVCACPSATMESYAVDCPVHDPLRRRRMHDAAERAIALRLHELKSRVAELEAERDDIDAYLPKLYELDFEEEPDLDCPVSLVERAEDVSKRVRALESEHEQRKNAVLVQQQREDGQWVPAVPEPYRLDTRSFWLRVWHVLTFWRKREGAD